MPTQTNTVTVTVDTREKGRIIQRLEELDSITLKFEELDVGDYLLPNGAVIERKSATDLILSIVDHSLNDKIARLKSNYEKPIYIIEGDMYTARFHQKALDIHRALAHMTLTLGVPVLPSPDADNSAMLIYLMALEAATAQQHGASRAPAPKIRYEAQKYMLQGMPGIDTDKAIALLKHFGSARKVFAADTAAMSAAGLEEKAAEKIILALDYEQPR